MNNITSEEILQVLKAIKEECSETQCYNCRFHDEVDGCVFKDFNRALSPCEWLLNGLAANMAEWEGLI